MYKYHFPLLPFNRHVSVKFVPFLVTIEYTVCTMFSVSFSRWMIFFVLFFLWGLTWLYLCQEWNSKILYKFQHWLVSIASIMLVLTVLIFISDLWLHFTYPLLLRLFILYQTHQYISRNCHTCQQSPAPNISAPV